MNSSSIKIVPQVPCCCDSVVTYCIFIQKPIATLEKVPKTKRPITIKHYFMHPQNEIFFYDFSKKHCD